LSEKDECKKEDNAYEEAGEIYAKAIFYGFNLAKGSDWHEFSVFATIVAVSCYVLLVVVIMNLLIALVSSSFERVTNSSV